MPGNWVHYYFAKDVARDHDFPFRRDKSYSFGALGPDILMHLPEKLLTEEDYYRVFHEDNTPELLHYIFQRMEKEELIPFLHGFLAHYALDSGSNFFILSLQNEGYDRQSVKDALEEAILRRRKIGSSHKISFLPQINVGKTLPDAIADFFVDAARDIYQLPLSKEDMQEAYQTFMEVIQANETSFLLFRLRRRWYERKSGHLFSKEETEQLFQEFQESYEKARRTFGLLLEKKKPCSRNFLGDYL